MNNYRPVSVISVIDKVLENSVTYRFSRAKSEALFNIYSFLKENIKSSNTKDKVKTTRRTVKNNNNGAN